MLTENDNHFRGITKMLKEIGDNILSECIKYDELLKSCGLENSQLRINWQDKLNEISILK